MKKIIIIVVALVLLLVIAGGAAFVMLSGGSKPMDAEIEGAEGLEDIEEVVEKPDPYYLEIRPPFVVTLIANEKSYFLQVETALLTYKQENFDALEKNQPAIKAALVDLYSEQNIDLIKTKEGKDQLKERALEAVKDVMLNAYGEEAVEGIYFTKFVIQ